MDNDSNITIEESISYGGDVGSFQELILQHLRKCISEGSKEMDGGGVRRRLINGEVVEMFFPNQREIFVNAVEMLEIALTPKLREPFSEQIKEIEQFTLEEMSSNKNMVQSAITNLKNKEVNHNKNFPQNQISKVGEINKLRQALSNQNEELKVNAAKNKLAVLSALLNDIQFFGEGTLSNV